MSLYTPVFPPFPEHRSTGCNRAPSSHQPSSAEILRDIHLFLAAKPEILAPSSRPNSPSFDANVEKLKQSVLEVIHATRGDIGNGRWSQVSEKLKMGCVRGRYRMTGLNQGWHPFENAEWILPDDEETWFKLEKERAEAKRLNGKAEQSFHPGDIPGAAVTPSHMPDTADVAFPVEIVGMRETVSPKTMRNVTKKVAKWRATITTFEGAASVQSDAPKSDLKTLTKNKTQSSSLGFPVVKRNTATAAGKGRSNRNPLPNIPADEVRKGGRENDSKSSAVRERQVPCEGGSEKASFKSPLRSLVPDGELAKITDFPEMPYIPPSFSSQLETSTPLRRETMVPVRMKPPPIQPVSSISHLPTHRSGDQDPCEDPYIVDLNSLHPLHSDDPQVNKRPLSPYDAAPSTMKKRRAMLTPEDNSVSHCRFATPSADDVEVEKLKCAVMPTSSRSEGELPELTDLLAGSPFPKVRPRPLLEDILLVEPSLKHGSAQENSSPTKSYFSTPGSSGSSDSPASRPNLLHSPLSPMLSFAQNPNAFLPQFTSTQPGGSRRKGTSSGNFGVGYSSQFDVERHVDRVSELLEKDVDFDGWLRDAKAAEDSHD